MSSGDLLSASGSDDATLLASPVRLPCGRTVPSRLVKAAMYEGLATFPGGPPNESHFNLYTAWARGGWGMIITGNVQVSAEHLTLGRDMIVPEKITTETIAPFRLLADAMHSSASPQTAALALMQLSHSGRQSPRIIGGRSFWLPPLAPSPVKMSSSGEGLLSRLFYAALFPTPREMSDHDIEHIIERFVEGAKVALDAGFDGIQLHSAHGYFLAQILSPKTNLRQPPYGYPNELNVLKKIVKRIRSFAPPAFVIGIKLNAADYASGGLSDQHALEHVKTIAGWAGERAGVDFIEISGGDYEQPTFATAVSLRQALFSRYSRMAVAAVPPSPEAPLVMLTGSLRSRSIMASSIRSAHAHLLGVGRPSISHPNLPQMLLSPSLPDDMAFPATPTAPDPIWARPVAFLGAGIGTAWWMAIMQMISQGREPDSRVSEIWAAVKIWLAPVESLLESGLRSWVYFPVILLVLYIYYSGA